MGWGWSETRHGACITDKYVAMAWHAIPCKAWHGIAMAWHAIPALPLSPRARGTERVQPSAMFTHRMPHAGLASLGAPGCPSGRVGLIVTLTNVATAHGAPNDGAWCRPALVKTMDTGIPTLLVAPPNLEHTVYTHYWT